MKQSRWRSWVVWSAIVAQFLSIGQLSGLFNKWGIDGGALGDIIASVLQLLVVFGVLNNPTSKEEF